MDEHGTFEDLSPEQQRMLTALLEELSTFPVPEMIFRCAQIVGVDPANQADVERMDAAGAGAWAYDRMLSYLVRLRSLVEEQRQIGKQIREFKQHPDPRNEEEVDVAAWARVMAPRLAGDQEVILNFISVSVQHIRSLLKVVAEAVGYDIPAEDLAFLDEFRHLRNHFEHWHNRLPGKANETTLIKRTETAEGYRIQGGLEGDAQNRIIVIEPTKPGPVTHAVEVTDPGMARVEKIVRETDEKVKALALEGVRTYFIAHPEIIPSPKDIPQDLLFSAGG
jgi:hypothetical protein